MSTNSKRRSYCRFGITPEPENQVLGFLWRIIFLLGYVPSTFAKACGISQQLMHHYRTSDDCYLSTVQQMLGRVGIAISVSLKKRDSKEDGDSPLVKGLNYSVIGQLPTRKNLAPKYIRNCAADSRLSFLARALSGLSEREICERAGVKRGKLIWAFHHDDIHISDLSQIATSLGFEVVWHVSKSDENCR